ncbi:MAG: luciferase family protein [Ornithinimicrobium sp.]|uniref:luciferase domain-containing protein n=1 Tax=Ornithinimicrobium sp. TaxID=1977084 RepID=UPI003D9BA680
MGRAGAAGVRPRWGRRGAQSGLPCRLEPAHLHGVDDTSVHLCLPVTRGQEVVELGWAEPHQYADHDTELMVYGPRNPGEVDVVVSLIQESIAHARRD